MAWSVRAASGSRVVRWLTQRWFLLSQTWPSGQLAATASKVVSRLPASSSGAPKTRAGMFIARSPWG